MMEYPMIQLCRAMLQYEARDAEKRKDAAEKRVAEASFVLTIQKDMVPKNYGDMWQIRVCFSPREMMMVRPQRIERLDESFMSNSHEMARMYGREIAAMVEKRLVQECHAGFGANV